MSVADLSVADRLVQVLDHLGIESAHFAASMLADITGLVQAHPERIASLMLVCPPRVDPSAPRRRDAYGVVTAKFGVLSMGAAAVSSQHALSHGHAWRS
jgi:hypothetical protein